MSDRPIVVTAQPHLNHNPTPTQQKVGWDTVITKKPPHPPQTQTTWKNKNRAILRKQNLLVYINRAQISVQVQPQPKDSPIGPKKAQNDPKREKNQKARKQEILQNESYHSTLVNLKNIFQALHKPQTCSTWPKKAHNDPKYHKIKK